ncbi:hypothetical protein L6452_04573 [Arctium lappa]|uniref:Uncharacterized protein n=1 Tax=Arctium lappa TaxID=4217 RepID=A0ACB9EED3_ARCLA|nr:hypothetical protein L6452_04573 [Arctium lappa]
MALEIEIFSPIEKPRLRLFGAAASARGRPFVNIVELIASRRHFVVVIELPHVKCYDGEVEWTVNDDSLVTIEGQIDVGEIFSDVSSGLKRRRVQLCPTEQWSVSFYLPGPVEWWTASVFFTSSTVMELIVEREIPLAGLATTSAATSSSIVATTSAATTTYVVASISRATTSAVATTSAMASTSAVATTSAVASTSAAATTFAMASTSVLDGSTSPGVDDIDEMIAGWLI